MFIIKNNYYLYIENTKNVNFNYLKNCKKISIIYRNNSIPENISDLTYLREKCRKKNIKFYVANNLKLAKKCRADGMYISAYNKKNYTFKNLSLIGSAHSFKEINEKIKQGCKTIILSRIFATAYKNKKSYLGLIKFNLMVRNYKINFIALGGINSQNLLMLNLVNCSGIALLSEVKKKPAISNRLF